MRAFMLFLIVGGVALTAGERPRVNIYPAFAFEGAAARVMCRVPRDVDNRAVTWGVELWGSSSSELAGDRAPLYTREVTLVHAPCGAGPAFCEVTRAGRSAVRVTAPFTVSCQDE